MSYLIYRSFFRYTAEKFFPSLFPGIRQGKGRFTPAMENVAWPPVCILNSTEIQPRYHRECMPQCCGVTKGSLTGAPSQRRGSGVRACIVYALSAFLFSFSLVAEDLPRKPLREYQIKASLTFNFLQFVRWPPSEQEPMRNLCLVGKDQYGMALDALHNQIVEGHRIAVHRFKETDVAQLSKCHVLLLYTSNSTYEDKILSTVASQAILTVGESEDFLARGGMVRLFVADNRVVFDINRAAALAARLQVSSKLLRLARQVYDSR